LQDGDEGGGGDDGRGGEVVDKYVCAEAVMPSVPIGLWPEVKYRFTHSEALKEQV
jgi:hypothetical protein